MFRAWLLGTPLLLVALAASGSAGHDAAVPVHIPGVAKGDYWSYRMSGEIQGSTRTEVLGEETRIHNGQQVSSLKMEATTKNPAYLPNAPQTVVQQTSTTEKLVRRADYATLQVDTRSEVAGTYSFTQQEYTPPQIDYYFPFGVGSKWKVETNETTRKSGNSQEAEVTAIYTVEQFIPDFRVAAGTFDVWVIKIEREERGRDLASNTIFRQYYAPEACSFVREQELDTDHKTVLTTLDLTGYRCSHAAKDDPSYPAYVTLMARPAGPAPQEGPSPAPHDDAPGGRSSAASGLVTGLVVAAAGFLAAVGLATLLSRSRRG